MTIIGLVKLVAYALLPTPCSEEEGVERSLDAARTSAFVPGNRATMAMNVKDLAFTFEGAYATGTCPRSDAS